MDISGASTTLPQGLLSFDWLLCSTLPARLLTRLLRLVLGLLILNMARTVLGLLKQGDGCEQVSALSQRLNVAQPDSAVNRYCGSHTRRPAVVYQQRGGGMMVDGVAGPQMMSILENQSTPIQSTPTQSRFSVKRTDSLHRTLVDGSSAGLDKVGAALPLGRFVVILPQRCGLSLEIVKQLVPDAIEGQSYRGRYIQAGTFASQSAAAQHSRFLQAYGFDVQVAYCE